MRGKLTNALLLWYYWDVKGKKCDTQQGHAGSPAALSNAGVHFYSSTPPPFPPTAHLSCVPHRPLTSGHVCMALIGGGPTGSGSVGGIPAWVRWAVPAEHLYTRALGKLQVTSTRTFLQCRDTQTAGAGVSCRRVTMLAKSHRRQLYSKHDRIV